MTRDNLASMSQDSVCQGPFPEIFGVRPKSIEAIAPEYLAPQAIRSPYDSYREHGGR
jgi:NADH dehydrogenase